jgi:hypothetical protein
MFAVYFVRAGMRLKTRSMIRAGGVLIALGAIVWSIGWLQAGPRPLNASGMPINDQFEIWASGVFQLCLIAMLLIMRITRATGTSRAGRWILDAESVAVLLAIAWTIPYLFDANRPSTVILTVLDVFWPLSILGLVAVGFMVMRAKRWPSPVRYLPFVASLIIPVDILLMLSGVGEWTEIVVRSIYLAVTYTVLGVFVIRQVDPLVDLDTDAQLANDESPHKRIVASEDEPESEPAVF